MKKLLIFIIPLVLAIIVFLTFIYFTVKGNGKGALQVTSNPKSTVYLNGKPIGTTPLCKCEGNDTLSEGEYTLRLVPLEGEFLPFSEKIKITKSVLTVADRTFGKGATSDGSIINLESLNDKKNTELLIISLPQEAQVLIDSVPSGKTPILLKNLTASDHEIRIVKDGYKEKSIRIKTTLGYKLTISVYLGISLEMINLSPTPLSSPSATPTLISTKVLILETPTGFLNVRENGSLNTAITGRVNPGEMHELISEQDGWFEIKLEDNKTGWINSQYAQKQ